MAQSYVFGDASKPGLLLGLSVRRSVPVIVGVMWLSLSMLMGAPVGVAMIGPVFGLVVTFGAWRGVTLAEMALPAGRLLGRKALGRASWTRSSLLGAGPGYEDELPAALAGLELTEVQAGWLARTQGMAVLTDRKAGTVSAVLRGRGQGFSMAGSDEQDSMLAGWGSALSPLARERCPVARVTWHEWANPLGSAEHGEFLAEVGMLDRLADPLVADYQALRARQNKATVAHEVLVVLTAELRRVRARRGASLTDTAIEALVEETQRFCERLTVLGLGPEPLTAPELTARLRVWSDPTRAAQVETLGRSLAAAAGRGAIEWGPMAVEPRWGHCAVDRSVHRSYRIASWPALPVAAPWLGSLLGCSGATRTVTVVMEPVPVRVAAKAAQREVMHREADTHDKTERGFHVSAQDHKRTRQARRREQELTEGHAEFRFVGLVDVAAADLDALEEASAMVEQAAAQSMLDLRPLEARHELGWVASLPVGRGVSRSSLG